MTLEQQVERFINSPYPLWEKETTKAIVSHKWKQLESVGINKELYNTPTVFNKSISIVRKTEDFLLLGPDIIYIEFASADLSDFYENNGLNLYTDVEIEQNNAVAKIKDAINLLNLVPGVYECISSLVRSVQILRSDDPEMDVSYSHPNIPFTIFVSICQDSSEASILRVAESILHESMHLLLTLLENRVDLIIPNSEEKFYSPWREELRPSRGVLHGIFVFMAIRHFYNLMFFGNFVCSEVQKQYMKFRIEQIDKEIEPLADFSKSAGLTTSGKVFSENLLNKV